MILHVLSYAKPIGGDSRYAWRWILRDRESKHSVAITTQADVRHLYEILRSPTSTPWPNRVDLISALEAPISKPLEQSRGLRRLCQTADVVVLHLYPYDIIPLPRVVCGLRSVKTLFVNHPIIHFDWGEHCRFYRLSSHAIEDVFKKSTCSRSRSLIRILPIPIVSASAND
jgi:hypothetical protein